MAQHNDTGKWGETLATEYLRKNKYTIRDTNWRNRHRDIDIVALTPDMRTLVFVEVKTRTSDYFQQPEDTVDKQKVRNIALAANAYIKQNRIQLDTRFDIITVLGDSQNEAVPIIRHWESAFNPMLIF